MAPFKVAVASATDLRNANSFNASLSDLEQEDTSVQEEVEMGSDSPPASPARSTTTSSTSSQPPLGPELTPSKFPELINDPNLSQAAISEATEDNGDLENMDLLLDDAGAGGGSWADDI